jgi:hypothetical protein
MLDQKNILRDLRATAEAVTAEISRLPLDAAAWEPEPGEWSQLQTLTHMHICERHIFLPRMQKVAAEDHPALPLVDEPEIMKQEWNPKRLREELLKEYLACREQELALLEKADWARQGTHASRGPVTLGWLASYALSHTHEHLSQIMRVRLHYENKKP